MARRVVTEDNGRIQGWFDDEKAQAFDEEKRWDGHNHISRATGSQWVHERLYRTAEGRWILYHWSNYQGGDDTYTQINNADAAAWLVTNGHQPHDACKTEYEEMEIK